MAKPIPSDNIAYQLRRGQPNLMSVSDPEAKKKIDKETLNSTYRADYKTPKRSPPPERGKRRELMERYLFEKISADIASHEFRPRSPPTYVTTTRDHFDVPGFDPDTSLLPKFRYTLYTDPAITFWSENRRQVPGVTVPDNPTGYFNHCAGFTKPVSEKWDNDHEL